VADKSGCCHSCAEEPNDEGTLLVLKIGLYFMKLQKLGAFYGLPGRLLDYSLSTVCCCAGNASSRFHYGGSVKGLIHQKTWSMPVLFATW